ncbi:MAG: Ppx/GppA phosphatase family protein, partial [Pseudomonadota bacterium]
ALDLGTNNCRLLVARPVADGFRVIDAFSRIVRLGEGLSKTNALSRHAMDRAIDAIKVCADKMDRRQVTLRRNVATEACRIAENCDEFVVRVREETGLALDVISAAEEARLAVIGCQALIDPAIQNALVFDIGGGSTEIIWVKRTSASPSANVVGPYDIEIKAWRSFPFGVVNLSERYGTGRYGPALYHQIVQTISSEIRAFEKEFHLSPLIDEGQLQLLGTSGTVTTLGSFALGLETYDRNLIDGLWLERETTQSLCDELAELDIEQRAAIPAIGRDRCDLVVAGCTILSAIMGIWPLERLRVADRGLREGILRCLMTHDGIEFSRG